MTVASRLELALSNLMTLQSDLRQRVLSAPDPESGLAFHTAHQKVTEAARLLGERLNQVYKEEPQYGAPFGSTAPRYQPTLPDPPNKEEPMH